MQAHNLYIFVYIFNIPESLYIIQPLYLTKTELKKSVRIYCIRGNSLNNNSFTEIVV